MEVSKATRWRRGCPHRRYSGLDEAQVEGIAPDALAAALERGEAEVVDVSASPRLSLGARPLLPATPCGLGSVGTSRARRPDGFWW